MIEDGETIADERKVKDMIERFWGDATYRDKKEFVDGGMKNEVIIIRI